MKYFMKYLCYLINKLKIIYNILLLYVLFIYYLLFLFYILLFEVIKHLLFKIKFYDLITNIFILSKISQ